jgi:membrane-associated protease RseP (regulator of RpoE activity)
MATPFHDLARKRDLWWQFTIRTVELRHRGSYLGIVWAVLTPLLMLGLYYVVFGQIFGGSFGVLPDETRTDYALAFFLGLILHQVTSETLSLAPGIILANPNLVKKVVQDLIEHGEVRRAFLGIMIQDVNSELAQKLELKLSQGVYVNEVLADGAAQAAGMLTGDIVVRVNGINIKSVPELQEQIGSRNPGDEVILTVFRNGQQKDLNIKLKE